VDSAAIATRLAAARTRLILDQPFLGALVLRLPMVAADRHWCPTTATDARKFYYNAEYIASLSIAQTQFLLAHEALHCALSHFARRQHRVQHRWDLACDYAINPLLVEEGLTPPPNADIMPLYQGMTAEEIYPLLADNDASETLDRHVYDHAAESGDTGQPPSQADGQDGQETPPQPEGADAMPEENRRDAQGNTSGPDASRQTQQAREEDGTRTAGEQPERERQQEAGEPMPPPLGSEERANLDAQWQQYLAGAAQQALQSGKSGGGMARLIEHLLQPQLPWRMLLARYMSAAARDDFSYMRPSRREGAAILPSLKSTQIEILVAIDTSGSVRAGEVEAFCSEIMALKGQLRARVILLACDAAIAAQAPWIYEPWENFDCPATISGGGGTDFCPVFEWVADANLHPQLLVYFTDAKGSFPEHEPNYPVIWLVKGKEPVPWGQRIQLN